MPANLTPEAKVKWNAARNARTPKEKLQAFQDFLSAIPKHKGNERLRAQIKTKIAVLKEEIASERSKRGRARSTWHLEREGAARIVMLGPTNAGRSSLLGRLTNAQPSVAAYAYTTRRPVPGMLAFEDIRFQLVELPAPVLTSDGRCKIQPEAIHMIRTADGLVIVLDCSEDAVQQFVSITKALEEPRISIERQASQVDIVTERRWGEIRIAASGNLTAATHEQIRELLQSYGVRSALVRIHGNASIEDVEDAVLENVTIYKPTILVGNKIDIPNAHETSRRLEEQVPRAIPVIFTSCITGEGLNEIGEQIFRNLGIIRVYTKEPNEPSPSSEPFVVRAGTTVRDLARSIHTDLADRYRYSRIWGPSSKFAGERVGPDHILGDRDIVEIHSN